MKKLSMILMLAFVCGSFAMAQTSNVSKKATLMEAGTIVSDLKTGEVIRTTGGSIPADQIQINGSVSISGNGSSTGTTSKQTTPGSINNVTLGGLTTTGQAPAGGVQTIKTPGGSVTGNNGGNNLINATNQAPTGPGSGVTQKTINLTTPLPINTSNQVTPQ